MKYINFLLLNSALTSLSFSELRLRSAYSIAQFLNKVQPSLDFFQKQLNEAILTYSEKDEKGNPRVSSDGGYVIQKDKLDEATQKIDEISNFEIETPELKIYYDDLPEQGLTPKDLQILMPYIIV